MMFNLTPFLSATARRPLPPEQDALEAALSLSDGTPLRVYTPQPLVVEMPGITHLPALPQPLTDEDEESLLDEVSVVLLAHQDDPVALAAEVERRLHRGQRLALVDLKFPGRGDPALLTALLDSTVYVGNLAGYDLTVQQTLLPAMIPLRDGQAHRHYLAHSWLYNGVWRGMVEAEIERRFGATIPADQMYRAVTQARSRLGAYLVNLHRRGLRFDIQSLAFPDGQVAAMTFTLQAAAQSARVQG